MDGKYFEQVVLVLYMIILGLGMVQHVSNVGHCLRRQVDVSLYWIHTLWVMLVFVLQTQMAEHIYGFRCNDNWNNAFVLLVLANPLVAYVAVALCFPNFDRSTTPIDLRQHYGEMRTPFFVSLAVLVLSNYLTTSTLSQSWSVGPYQVFLLVFLVLFLVLAFVSHDVVHAVISVTIAVAFVVFSVFFSSNFAKELPVNCQSQTAVSPAN